MIQCFCMMKKILWKISVALLAVFLPLAVFAETSAAFPDGTVLQARGMLRRYFMKDGTKMPIKNAYTFRELGIPQKDVLKVKKQQLQEIPEGETLKISRPKFSGMFDMHEHFRAGGDMDLYLRVAKELGVEKAVFVPTGMGPDNKGYKSHMAALLEEQKKHPDRVIAFCTVDEADPEAPKIFEQCIKDGGKGLKLLVGHPEFYDTAIDAPVMKELFEVARKYDVPVLVHISIITTPKMKPEFMNLLDEFPDVRVQYAHYCSTVYNGVNLEQCAEFLDKYPNLYLDLSMGGGIQRYFKYMTQSAEDLKEIRDFIITYQDRIFYGTDMIVAAGKSPTRNPDWVRGRMMCDFSLHQERWYRCPTVNKGEYALLPGLELPNEVLEKMYVKNPKKFLNLH